MLLSDVCLSRTSGLSREQRSLGRPKLAQRQTTSHVTRTPLSRSKGQRSRSPGRFTQRGLNALRRLQRSAWECIRRGKVLLRCVCSAAHEALGRPRGEERGGGILCRHAHSLLTYYYSAQKLILIYGGQKAQLTQALQDSCTQAVPKAVNRWFLR